VKKIIWSRPLLSDLEKQWKNSALFTYNVNNEATKRRKEGKRGEADLGEVLSFTVAVLWW
jgi:hypothetical protein